MSTASVEDKYTVFVGGVEVNDYLLTKKEADLLAFEYKIDGYDDVGVERVATAEYNKQLKQQEGVL